ncbi:MAG: phage major capsid protein [Gammaproteobacteria bacterium]
MSELPATVQQYLDGVKGAFSDFTQANDARYERLRSRISDIEIAQKRVGLGGFHAGEDRTELNKGLRTYIRHGDASALYTKGMAVSDDPSGGYFAPVELQNSITSTVFNSSPIRQVARVVTVDSPEFEEILDRHEPAASWVSETEGRPETATPEIGKLSVPVHEHYANPKVTQKLLDDAKIDLAAWLTAKVGDKFGRAEATAFVSGDGIGKPRGFLSYPTAATSDATRPWGTLEYTASGASGAFASSNPGDKLIDMVFALKAGYRSGATWLMNSKTIAATRKLKDGQGNYLWQTSVIAGQPDLLIGYPMLAAEDMPDMTANSLSIAFGNFQRGYTIVDRHPMRMLRDPYTAKPHVLFYTYRRVGGDVMNFEAIKLLKFATS